MRWIKRFALSIGLLVLLTALVGFTFEQWRTHTASRTFLPPGELYDIAGRHSHLHCSGVGTPTIILESGLDFGGSASWSTIYPDLADAGRVCSYDRAGIMWSQSRKAPRDAVNIADELHALLVAANETPPYVMVGHSLGGPLIRVFDDRFAGEVAGFVFVDASHPEQFRRLPPKMANANPPPPVVRTLASLGILRLIPSLWAGLEVLPESSAQAIAALGPRSAHGAMAEMEMLDTIFAQSMETGSLGDRPLIVLTATMPPAQLPPRLSETWQRGHIVWHELQAELAALSTNSDHRVISDATHYVHWDQPAAVLTAVRDVVAAVSHRGSVQRREAF